MQPLHLLAGKAGLAYLVEMVIPIRLPVFGLLLKLPFMLASEDECSNSPTKATSGQQQQQSRHKPRQSTYKKIMNNDKSHVTTSAETTPEPPVVSPVIGAAPTRCRWGGAQLPPTCETTGVKSQSAKSGEVL